MPALNGFTSPTRTDIEAFDVPHLESADTHWTTTAKLWESTFESLHTQTLSPGGTAWTGDGADAAADRAWGDVVKVRSAVDCLQTAASAARHGAGEIVWAKAQVLDAIEEAQMAGFTVEQDFSVTDRSWSPLMRGFEARQARATAFATEITSRVQKLVNIDGEVAAKITTALAPLDELTFHENGTVQAVTFKTAPAPDDPRLMTKEQALAAWDKLNLDIASYNGRCSVAIVGPLPVPQYNACLAERESLDIQQAALRARLADFGIYPDGALPGNSGHPRPETVAGPGNESLPAVPPGAAGTVTDNGKGMVYDIPPGSRVLDPRVVRVRVMDPVTTGNYQYPNGYVSYENSAGQAVNPITGQTISRADPYWHIPLG
ncbi:hypothetical protein [Mycobacterium sp. DL440]|uniref:hypothetical protein n=1 Tax=Mycobacterium sp. DL440 TaxID=2675523 RepID=UPI0014249C0A|nr:hypothetical protein [Mycobacterium sp. DL440]